MAVSHTHALTAAVQDAAVAAPGGRCSSAGSTPPDARQRDRLASAATAAALRGGAAGAQHDAQAAALGVEVYVFGGGVVASFDHILRLRPGSGAVQRRALPARASDVAVATIGGTAYIVGGYDGRAPWTRSSPGGRAPRASSRGSRSRLRYAAVAAVGGRLIIAGGTAADGASATRSSATTPPGDGAVVQTGVLPTAVTHASSAVTRRARLPDRRPPHGRRRPDRLDRRDRPGERARRRRVGALPAPLSDAAVVAAGGRILVAGGRGRRRARPCATSLSLAPSCGGSPVRGTSAPWSRGGRSLRSRARGSGRRCSRTRPRSRPTRPRRRARAARLSADRRPRQQPHPRRQSPRAGRLALPDRGGRRRWAVRCTSTTTPSSSQAGAR